MNIEDYDENKHGKAVVKSNLPDYDPEEHGEILPPPNDDGSIGRDARARYFWYSIGDEGETWHGSQKVISKDAKDKKEGKISYDIAFGHKLTDEELKTNSIYGFPLADKTGNPLDLTRDQGREIMMKDADKHLKLALKSGWKDKLARLGLKFSDLGEEYQLALNSLAYNVGGAKAGKAWEDVLTAAADDDLLSFAHHMRRNDAGEKTAGMDNRVAKELYFSGLIDSMEDVASVLPLADDRSGIPMSSPQVVTTQTGQQVDKFNSEESSGVSTGPAPEPVQDGWHLVGDQYVKFENGQPDRPMPQMTDMNTPLGSLSETLTTAGLDMQAASEMMAKEEYTPFFSDLKKIGLDLGGVLGEHFGNAVGSLDTGLNQLGRAEVGEGLKNTIVGGVELADIAGVKGVGAAGVGMIADVARRGGVLSDRVRGSLDKFKGKITGGVKGAEADLHDYKTKLYKEAGIWENPIDGSLRYELHPEGYTAAVKKLDFEPKPVDEILLGKDYDQLRKLYPELEDVTVQFYPLGTPSRKRGMYNTKDKTISVNSSLSHEQIRSTLHHELQHALQQADKVIDGASMPKDAAKLPRTDYLTARLKYLTNQGEVEARAVQEALKGNTNVHPLLRDNIGGVVTGNGKKANLTVDSIDDPSYLDNAVAQKTQRGNTGGTATKAFNYLNAQGGQGRSLDYGAGLGENAKLTKADDTFEPFPQKGFQPTFTSPEEIPEGAYGRIYSTNVLNVLPRNIRDEAVQTIGKGLSTGGKAVVQTWNTSMVNALGKSKTSKAGPEVNSFISGTGTYQKGFAPKELQEYVQSTLGDGYKVSLVPSKEKISGVAVMIERLK